MSQDEEIGIVEFLGKFFGDRGDQSRHEEVVSSQESENVKDLGPWIAILKSKAYPALLPRKESTGLMEWYACAFSDEQVRRMKEDLTAFIGPTYTDFSGRLAVLDPANSMDRLVEQRFGKRVMRFRLLDQGDNEKVQTQIDLMTLMWARKPNRIGLEIRPSGRILRDFDLALQVGNWDSAVACIAELRNYGYLNSLNLLFLKLRLLAAREEWQEIIELTEFPSLLGVHRPRLVTQCLVQAVYRVHLQTFEEANDVDGGLAKFKSDIVPMYGRLFYARGAMMVPEVLKAFAMFAAASDPPRLDSIESILLVYPKDRDDRRYLEALANRVVRPSTPNKEDFEEIAIASYHTNNFDNAFELLLQCPPRVEILKMLLRCAYEISTLESARRVIRVFEKQEESVRRDLLSTRFYRSIWEYLISECDATKPELAHSIPDSLLSWFVRLDAPVDWDGALEVLDKGLMEWRIEPLLLDPEKVELISKVLEKNRPLQKSRQLRNGLPRLLRFFLPDAKAHRPLKPIYQSLLLLMGMEEDIGADDLLAIQDVVRALFDTGLTPKEYEVLLHDLNSLWQSIGSPTHLDWALDMLDLTAVSPVREPKSRDEFFSAVLASVTQWPRRIQSYQLAMFKMLGSDLAHPEVVDIFVQDSVTTGSDEQPRSLGDALKDLKIGIYTLTETVAQRVKAYLEKECEAVRIDVSCDHVGTDHLRTMAKSCDIMILATRSAKHAATQFIEAHRSKSRPTLYPAGKGTSSMLKVLYDHFGIRM